MSTGYALNYAWGHPDTGWSVGTDVLLEARLTSTPDTGAAIAEWLVACPKVTALVDGTPTDVAVLGGVWAYADEEDGRLSVKLHARGEDAFDALAVVAQDLERHLASRTEAKPHWIERSHMRESWLLSW